jgi:hypothetical protein
VWGAAPRGKGNGGSCEACARERGELSLGKMKRRKGVWSVSPGEKKRKGKKRVTGSREREREKGKKRRKRRKRKKRKGERNRFDLSSVGFSMVGIV